MVANLTVGKKKYAASEAALLDLKRDAEALRSELLTLARLDSEAFDAVLEARRLPQATPGESAERQKALEQASTEATRVPLRTAAACLEAVELAQVAARLGNVNAASDAGVAGLLARAAAEGAILNVRINLKSLDSQADREDIEMNLQRLQSALETTSRAAWKRCMLLCTPDTTYVPAKDCAGETASLEKAIEIKRRAQRCVQNGDLDGALGEYEKLVAADDSDPYNFVLLADLLYKKGDHGGAAKRYLSAADAYQKNTLYKNAIAVCKKMVRLSLSPALVLQKLPVLHGLDGLATEAVLFHMQHADLMLREDKPDEAAASLKAAFELSPENVKTLERLADVYLVKGDKEAAAAALADAAQRYQEAGQTAHAERCRNRMLQLKPGGMPRVPASKPSGTVRRRCRRRSASAKRSRRPRRRFPARASGREHSPLAPPQPPVLERAPQAAPRNPLPPRTLTRPTSSATRRQHPPAPRRYGRSRVSKGRAPLPVAGRRSGA
jgi:glutamate formiminotransferase/formiminotetrahydrofolate cyclodeaminase